MVTQTKPSDQQLADYRASKIRRLKHQCDLDRAKLLPEHENIFGELADAFVGGSGHSRPLDAVRESELTKVRGLLIQLPATCEIRGYLASTLNGPVKHRV